MEKSSARRQGQDRPRHRARRRARHRQEPRRHHPHQQRLRRDQPRHQAADRRHHRGGRRARRRRDRHVGPAGEVDRRDEGEPAGAATPAASRRSWPVILGGAALTRAYVEDDLASLFDGEVRYARDAFEGLALMEPLVAIARGAAPDEVGLPPLKKRIHARRCAARPSPSPRRCRRGRTWHPTIPFPPRRSGAPASCAASRSPTTPRSSTSARRSWGSGGSSPAAAKTGSATSSSSRREGRPRLRYWLDRILARGDARRLGRLRILPGGERGRRPRRAAPRRRPDGRARACRGCSRPTAGRAEPSATERLRFTSRVSAATATCASPTSCARASRVRSTCCRCSS